MQEIQESNCQVSHHFRWFYQVIFNLGGWWGPEAGKMAEFFKGKGVGMH